MNFSKLFDTIKGPLLGVVSSLIPGGPAILGAVNALLPDDKKLTDAATGQDMRNAVSQMSPDVRATLMVKQLDVEIAEIGAWESIQDSLSRADASGSSTRPYIALMMAWSVVGVVLVFISSWAYSIINGDHLMLSALSDSWPVLLSAIATPTALLRAYFGMRTKEKTARYSASCGQKTGIAGIMEAFRR